jgi:hypothetical protein
LDLTYNFEKKEKELKIATLCLKKYTKKFSIFEIEIKQHKEKIKELEKHLAEQTNVKLTQQSNLKIENQKRSLCQIQLLNNFTFDKNEYLKEKIHQSFQPDDSLNFGKRFLKLKGMISDLKLEKNDLTIKIKEIQKITKKIQLINKNCKNERNMIKKNHVDSIISFRNQTKNNLSNMASSLKSLSSQINLLSIQKTLYNCSFVNSKEKNQDHYTISDNWKNYNFQRKTIREHDLTHKSPSISFKILSLDNYSYMSKIKSNANNTELVQKIKNFSEQIENIHIYSSRKEKNIDLKIKNMIGLVKKIKVKMGALNNSQMNKDKLDELVEQKMKVVDLTMKINEIEDDLEDKKGEIKYLNELLNEHEERFNNIKDKSKKVLRKENKNLQKKIKELELVISKAKSKMFLR